MMKKLLLSLFLAAALATGSASAQVPNQVQLQVADAQLNQVYQQLRGLTERCPKAAAKTGPKRLAQEA